MRSSLRATPGIVDLDVAKSAMANNLQEFDLLFLGSYNGRTKVTRSTRRLVAGRYRVGTPLETTLYCAYGYVINRDAAAFLLERTRTASWPVDYWKKWLDAAPPDRRPRVGAIVPEVISCWDNESGIQTAADMSATASAPYRVLIALVELRNSIRGFLS